MHLQAAMVIGADSASESRTKSKKERSHLSQTAQEPAGKTKGSD